MEHVIPVYLPALLLGEGFAGKDEGSTSSLNLKSFDLLTPGVDWKT